MDPILRSNFIALFIMMKEHAASSDSHWLDLPRHRAAAKAIAERNLLRVPAAEFYELSHEFLEYYCMVLGYPGYKPAIGPQDGFDRHWLLVNLLTHRANMASELARQARLRLDQFLEKSNSRAGPSSSDEVVRSPSPSTSSPTPSSDPEH
jgi:hypothetical protein